MPRFQRSESICTPVPGPLARAITFGAFGAVQPRMQLASLGESDMLLPANSLCLLLIDKQIAMLNSQL